ncbi:MAG: AraC family transcriptional regulator, partial [Flavobacterium sp.]|uniref:helix-turn-helix domain-containing protein n=1 Tax=Flavobacterium sp. TaxID=239 RepID=UPI001213908F
GQLGSELLKLKVREITLLLLEKKPELASVLFDFNQPGKIVLKDFMLRNFHFNVSVERFAFLTGRSLSGFKRDFESIFGTSPRRWLQQKRLEEARFMIGSGRKPSEVYVDVGFENLSHFSSAFKKSIWRTTIVVSQALNIKKSNSTLGTQMSQIVSDL